MRIAPCLLAALALASAGAQSAPRRFDVRVRNGRVLDGSGNPWLREDVGIVGDRVVAVGDLRGRCSRRASRPSSLTRTAAGPWISRRSAGRSRRAASA